MRRHSKTFNKDFVSYSRSQKIRTFSWYLIVVCVFCSVFCFPYFVFDQLFYNDADVAKILNSKIVIYNQSLSKIQEIITDYNTKRKNSLMSLIFNENLRNEELIINKLFLEALTRLPLVLINLPHTIKFYVLLFFYSRFRHELCLLLRMRFYFNSSMVKKINIFSSNTASPNDKTSNTELNQQTWVIQKYNKLELELVNSNFF